MKTEEVNEPLQEAPADPVEDEVDEDLDQYPEDEPDGADGQEDAAAGTQETVDDADDDDGDLWDDWDDDDGADADDGSDAPESEPGSEPEPDAATEEPEADPSPADEPEAPAAPDANAELIDRLLTDLGYEGTAEEKVAKYKADNGISDPKQDDPAQKDPAQEETDIDTRAKRDLETLTKAYPDRMMNVKALKEIPEFGAVVRKMIASGCSMLEAYNEVVIGKVPSAKAEKQKAQAQSKSHLVGTPTAVRSSRFEPDTSELRELRRNFPDYSEERIRELYRKVQKNTR